MRRSNPYRFYDPEGYSSWPPLWEQKRRNELGNMWLPNLLAIALTAAGVYYLYFYG